MIKKIFKIFILLLLLIFIGITVFFLTFDINRHRESISQKVSEALGRKVSIGQIEMKISLIPTIILNDVQLDNASWSTSEKPMAKIDTMNVSFGFIPLFKGRFEMRDFQINKLNISLEKKGELANWQFAEESDEPAMDKESTSSAKTTPKMPSFSVDLISIKQVNLTYQDDTQTYSIFASNLTLQQLKAFSGEFIYGTHLIKISGTVDDLLNLVIGKPNYAFSLKAEAFKSTIELSGLIGNVAQLKDIYMQVKISGSRFNSFMQTFEQKLQFPSELFVGSFSVRGDLNQMKLENVSFKIANGKSLAINAAAVLDQLKTDPIATANVELIVGTDFAKVLQIKPFNVSFDVNLKGKELSVDKLVFYANKSDLSGNVNVKFGETRPVVVADLTSDYFDVYDLLPQQENTPVVATKPTTEEIKKVFSTTPFDLMALKAVNADVVLNIKHIEISDKVSDYIGLSAKLQLNDGVLQVNPLYLTALGGQASGYITVSGQTEPQVNVSLIAQGLQSDKVKALQSVLRDVKLNAAVDLKTAGSSVQSMMARLNGTISAEILSGSIVSDVFNSLPLPAMVLRQQASSPMAFSTSDQISKIICGGVNIGIRNGQIDLNENIALETNTVNFVVSGNVDLPNETLSLSMQPSVSATVGKTTNQVLSLTQAVKLSGPFTALKPSLDAESVSSAVAQVGLGILKDKLGQQSVQPYMLCESALGYDFPTKPVVVQPTPQNNPLTELTGVLTATEQPVEEEISVKEQFKRDLFNSLSKALSE